MKTKIKKKQGVASVASRKKPFKCAECYRRIRTFIGLQKRLMNREMAMEVLVANLARAQEWNRAYQKQVAGLTARVRELESDNTREIAVLTDDLTKAHDEIARLQSEQ